MLKSFVKKIIQKKGRSFLLLPFFICAMSCSKDMSQFGRIILHDATNKLAFSFLVNDDFLRDNLKSPQDKKIPSMTQAEAQLLFLLLKQQKYCLNGSSPLFVITSRQERIFDVTFAHLIEQN